MRVVIALHSTTGNTRLVTRFAARVIESRGHECEVIDIVRHPEPPVLDGVDLLGIASPTMSLRPTFTMEGYVTRLPNAPERRPAFLLNSCGGMPGATLAMLAEQLSYKGWVVLGADWILAPSNWPPHVMFQRRMAAIEPAAELARWLPRQQRWIPALFWDSVCQPDHQDRDDLERFVDQMLAKTKAGDLDSAPTPMELHQPIPTTATLGRIVARELPDKLLRFRVDVGRCTGCGTCVSVCSERIITQRSDHEVPTIGRWCSGCYACFNHCPEGAISDSITNPGEGQYRSPSRQMREIFRVIK